MLLGVRAVSMMAEKQPALCLQVEDWGDSDREDQEISSTGSLMSGKRQRHTLFKDKTLERFEFVDSAKTETLGEKMNVITFDILAWRDLQNGTFSKNPEDRVIF